MRTAVAGVDYARVFDAVPAPFLLLTPDLAVVDANRTGLQTIGTVPDRLVGRAYLDLFPEPAHEEGRGVLRASLERVRTTGRPDTLPIQRYDSVLPDGRPADRYWSFSTVPIVDDAGAVVLLLHRADDVTDWVSGHPAATADGTGDTALHRPGWAERMRQVEADLFTRTRELEQANAELRDLSERQLRTAQSLAGLAGTVSALAGAESRSELLRQLFRHGRMALRADALAVALLEPGGSHLAVVHSRDPAGGPTLAVPMSSSVPMAVAAGGRPVFEADADQGHAGQDDAGEGAAGEGAAGEGAAGGAGAAAPLPGLRAWAALPLRAGGRPLGSLTVGWDHPHAFDEDDVRVLGAFASQCAQAVSRVARLETERREASATRGLAEALQRSLLTAPPQSEDLDIAVRYRPAAREAQVGGDWYDAFSSPGGTVTLVVGDVTGHDWTAAALAGQLRNMLRGIAFALDGGAPDDVLRALDRGLHGTGGTSLATAVVARVEPPTAPSGGPSGGRIFRWSNAGHPPPLLLHPDGRAQLLERRPNLLLGVDPGAARREHAVHLPPGSTLVLYTDGLVERRDAPLDEGFARLQAAGRELADRSMDEVCDVLVDRLQPELTDDIALLAVRVRDAADPA